MDDVSPAPIASPRPSTGGCAHVVQFYGSDAFLLDEVARFFDEGVRDGGAIVVIATPVHRRGLEKRLRGKGVDLAAARARGWYVSLDALETLARVSSDGWPDEALFRNVIGGTIRNAAAARNGGVRAFGEMVAMLWAERKPAAALRLEALWNDLGRELRFSLFCAYPMRAFRRGDDHRPFLEICGAHSHVIPAESFTLLASPEDRFRNVSELQQKAQVLETEVGERQRVEDELKRRLEQLAESDRRKDEFLAMLGHELRNPLSAVRNAIATASLDETRRSRALEIARRQADQLGRLIDDLVDVARITQGRITLRKERVLLREILDRAMEATRPFVDDRGHRLNLGRADRVRVEADPARLEQVFVNLLTNAAKFTPPGGHIDLAIERAGDEALVRVRDSGIGIAPDVLPRIFELFGQADRSLDRAQGGLGVGLTLAARLVELHGGRIRAESDGPGRGAEFVVRLPAAAALPEDQADAPRLGVARSHGARVLMIEDNPDGAESLRMLLALLGYRVRVAADGPEGIRAAHESRPDVVLVDIGLPGIDGYEVARRIRNDPELEHLPLVALTGYGREEDRMRALAAGFDDHLVKPVELAALQEVVARLQQPRARDREPAAERDNVAVPRERRA